MTEREINVLLVLRDKTVQGIALAIKEDVSAVSRTISYERVNKRIREKIARHLGMPVEELFDSVPHRAKAGSTLAGTTG